MMMGQGRDFAKKGNRLRVSLDGMDITQNRERLDFHYLPHIKNIPGEIRAGALLSLLTALSNTGKERLKQLLGDRETGAIMKKTFRDMNAEELGKMFLAILDTGTPAGYLLNDVLSGMTQNFAVALKNRLFDLADAENKLAVFLTQGLSTIVDSGSLQSYVRCIRWIEGVEVFEKIKMRSEESQKEEGEGKGKE